MTWLGQGLFRSTLSVTPQLFCFRSPFSNSDLRMAALSDYPLARASFRQPIKWAPTIHVHPSLCLGRMCPMMLHLRTSQTPTKIIWATHPQLRLSLMGVNCRVWTTVRAWVWIRACLAIHTANRARNSCKIHAVIRARNSCKIHTVIRARNNCEMSWKKIILIPPQKVLNL